MLFGYYYSEKSGVAPRKTLRGNIEYTHCVAHDSSDEVKDLEIPEDAVLVAIEDVNSITAKKTYR